MSDLSKINWPGWDVVRRLGKGGFGAVYEIERDVFGKKEKAALKVMSVPESNEEIDELYSRGYNDASITSHFKGYLEEIVKEYSIMLDLKGHTNIVYCDELRYIQHDDGIGWDIYIKMELLQPLNKILDLEYSEEETLRLGIDLCNALILCKQESIIHRDIKPQNILVSKTGDYKLGDFGVAKVSDKTMSGTKIGTYEYMAPEVYKAEHYGHAADIYSLGLVMYWMMNRHSLPYLPLPPRIPTAGDKEAARNRRFGGEKLPPPVDGSRALQEIVLKACAYDQKDRFASAAEMRDALLWVQNGNTCAFTQETVSDEKTEQTKRDDLTVLDKSVNHDEKKSLNQSTGKSTHTKPKTKKLGIFLAILIVVLGIGAAGLFFCDISQIRDLLGAGMEELRQVVDDSSAEGSEPSNVSTTPPTDAATEPPTEAPTESPEDIAYRDTETYCATLDTQGSTAVALRHLQVLTDSGLADERYNQLLIHYENKVKEQTLQTANSYFAEGNTAQAIQTIWGVQDFYDCDDFEQAMKSYFRSYSVHRLAAGRRFTALLHENGTVSLCGTSEKGWCNPSGWTDVESIALGDYHIVGVKTDGTVLAAGPSEYCGNALTWKNISIISAGDGHTVGLQKDGTLVAAGLNRFGQTSVDELYGETPVVAIAAGYDHTVALHEDGTVTAIGRNNRGQCNVSDWTEIVAISAGSEHTVGLRADGTVVSTGLNTSSQCKTENWSNIVAICAGDYFTMGLQADGSVVAIGMNTSEQCHVEGWANVIEIAGGNHQAAGLCKDGTIVAAGDTSLVQF